MTTGPGGFWTRADNDGSFYPVAVDAPTDRSRSAGRGPPAWPRSRTWPTTWSGSKGLGPKAAALLHEVGVTKYAHIAGRSPAELASLVSVTGIGAERIARQDWVGQAAQMAATAAPRNRGRPGCADSFTVTVTGEPASGEVLGCEISHHQTEDGTVLRGWDTDGLTAFVQERTGLRLGPP
ncbi:hypothetical protein ACRAWF_20105 [Streptomyces sp. L7]